MCSLQKTIEMIEKIGNSGRFAAEGREFGADKSIILPIYKVHEDDMKAFTDAGSKAINQIFIMR